MLAVGTLLGVAAGAAAYRGRPAPIEVDPAYVETDPDTLSEYPDASGKSMSIGSARCDIEFPVFLAKKGTASEAPVTVSQWLQQAARQFPNAPALKVEEKNVTGDLEWTATSWSEYNAQVRAAAKAFIHLGVMQFDSVCIIGFNRPEWLIADLGAIWCGAKAAGIYATNEPASAAYIASHCKAKVVVAEDWKQVKKFIQVIDKISECRAFVVYRDISDSELKEARLHRPTYKWSEFMALSDDNDKLETTLNERLAAQRPGHVCTLIYTSGTTGPPKAVMVTHDAVTFMCKQVAFALPDAGSVQESSISYLPLSHIAAQVLDIYVPIWATALGTQPATLWFARPDALKGSLPGTLAAARPTFFFGVPRVYEKIAEKMQAVEASSTGLKAAIANWAKSVGRASYRNRQINGSHYTPWMEFIADALVFKQVQKKLGFDRCRVKFTGAAPISVETLEYLASVGLTVLELYGMSECTGACHFNTVKAQMAGSVGRSLEGIEVRLEHVAGRDKPGEGEILIRGRNNMAGYYLDTEKTSQTIDANGFIHSGDIGRKDEYGFYYISGRIKELIITAGGENIAPIPIEHSIKSECPALSNVIMIGDRMKYNVALVTLKTKTSPDGTPLPDLDGPALDVNPNVKTVSQAQKDPTWRAYIQKGIDATNSATTSNASKIQKFEILPLDLSLGGGELTPSMKACRPAIVQKYKHLIDSMYK